MKYIVHGGEEVLGGGTFLFSLKISTLERCAELHALAASTLGQWHGNH